MLMTEKLLTVAEVAEKLRKSDETIRRWIKQKKIVASQPGGREWYITEEEFNRFMRENQNV